jgi:hypothetical protein
MVVDVSRTGKTKSSVWRVLVLGQAGILAWMAAEVVWRLANWDSFWSSGPSGTDVPVTVVEGPKLVVSLFAAGLVLCAAGFAWSGTGPETPSKARRLTAGLVGGVVCLWFGQVMSFLPNLLMTLSGLATVVLAIRLNKGLWPLRRDAARDAAPQDAE